MISIVVPVYNAGAYLQKCIESILMQTCPDWELILVDNGSLDDSMEICKKYARLDDRIMAIHQYRNQGVSAARNLGLERCRGEFVTFVDADDWITEDYLETLLEYQKATLASIIICGYEAVYDEDRNQKSKLKTQKAGQIKIYDIEEYLRDYLLEGNTHCWGILFESSLLENIKFIQNLTIGEDLLFLLAVSLKTEKIAVSDYKGYGYYINNKGAMLKKFDSRYMDQITCWEKALEKIKDRYPKLLVKVESHLLVAVLLVVGKIAELEPEEQEQYQREQEECHRIFMQYAKGNQHRKYFPKGYPFKVFCYGRFPKLYLGMYGKLKRWKLRK